MSILTALLLSPNVAYAQVTVNSILQSVTGSLSLFVPVGVAAGVAVFVWGLVKFISASGDEKAHAEGRDRMIWGIVALFFMVTIWGIVALLQTIFGTGDGPDGNNCDPTQINTSNWELEDCV